MKAMSKFFLIVSGVLVAVGAVICVIGLILAKNQGVQLYDEKKDGNYIYTVDLENTDISKISVNATDADITVYTGQEKEYVEFINFNESYGSVSSTNTVLSFDEYINLSSVLTFWDGGFTFKGMRSLLDFGKAPSGEKAVNIYLSDTRNINVFSFTLEKGAVSFDNITSDTDYKLSVDSGSISMKNVSTSSKVYLNGTTCTVRLDDCKFESFTADAGDLKLDGRLVIGNEFNVNSKGGTLSADIRFASESPSASVLTSGTILIDGVNYSGAYKSGDDPAADSPDKAPANISVTGETLNVSINITAADTAESSEEKKG